MNGQSLIRSFQFFSFHIFATIIKELLICCNFSSVQLSILKQLFEIVLYIISLVILLICTGLSSQKVLNLTFVKLFIFNIIFFKPEILFLNGFVFVWIYNELNTNIKRFQYPLKCRNIGLLNIYPILVNTQSWVIT